MCYLIGSNTFSNRLTWHGYYANVLFDAIVYVVSSATEMYKII